MLKDRIQAYIQEIQATSIEKFQDRATEVEMFRVKYLGKKGIISDLFEQFKAVPKEDKKDLGIALNQLKEAAMDKIEEFKSYVEHQEEQNRAADLTLPADFMQMGSRHVLSVVMNEITEIFARLGFTVAESVEIEDDWHLFSALNFPPDHPARDMQDTYYLTNGELLKSQTSAAQNAILKKYGKQLMEEGMPIRAIFPGRCFRNEATDATHENTFFQMEGVMVDKDISISNLIYFMKTMLSEVFQKDVKVRLRPGFFPFVEPGFELDISCLICGGETGCPSCNHSGWLELCPCGMIHPEVLKEGGIDPETEPKRYVKTIVPELAGLQKTEMFLQVLADGNTRLLCQRKAKLTAHTGAISPKSYYFLDYGGKLRKFVPSRIGLYRLLTKTDRQTMKNIIRKNHLHVRNDADLAKAVSEFNMSAGNN